MSRVVLARASICGSSCNQRFGVPTSHAQPAIICCPESISCVICNADHLILVLVSTFVGTLLGAVGIAQYFGIFPLLAAAHGNRLEGGSDTSNSSKRLYGELHAGIDRHS
jgi:hypothetical protein